MTRGLIYSQDPGGANIVARVADRLGRLPDLPPIVTFVHPLSEPLFTQLGVPATPIADRFETLPASDDAIDRWLDGLRVSHVISTLSSRHVDLTNGRLIARARARGIGTLGYLDHWVGSDRLTTAGGELRYLPDVVGCIDEDAKRELGRLGVSPDAVREVGHPHLEAVAAEAAPPSMHPGRPARVLFVSQPVAADGSFVSVFQLDWAGRPILDTLMDALRPLGADGSVTLAYRAHPKERPSDRFPSDLGQDHGPAGMAILARHDLFVGLTSMLLFEAAVARRAVVQLDVPVLRQSITGSWPPVRAGAQVREPDRLATAVLQAVADLRRGERPANVEGLQLAGSLDRATAVAVEFLQGAVGPASREPR